LLVAGRGPRALVFLPLETQQAAVGVQEFCRRAWVKPLPGSLPLDFPLDSGTENFFEKKLTPLGPGLRVKMVSEDRTELSDEELMVSYLAGDQKAFETVYSRRRAGLRRFFERQCGSQAVAQELAQEVWFKLIRACQREQYTAEAKFTTYLYRMARNQMIDWYRRNGDVKTVELMENVESEEEVVEIGHYTIDDPERVLSDKQRRDALMTAIESLSAEQRTTLLMQLEGDMSYDEIAEATGTNRETVKTRLRYAREHLKKRVLAHYAA
jgi:RNA polymerase sigma-70 factor (ECF subfamily)